MTPPRPGQLQVGWQYAAAYPDPGPPPRRPTPPDAERLSPDWVAAQRREESRLNRPLKAAFAVAVVLGLVLVALGAAGSLGALLTGARGDLLRAGRGRQRVCPLAGRACAPVEDGR